MDHPGGVGRLEPLGHLPRDVEGLLDWKRRRGEEVGEVLAGDEFQNQEVETVPLMP